METKVSVIMPVYNGERFLREGLDCLVGQTLKDVEFILVDDGSSDNSLEIMREYEKRDPRISVFTQENSGAAVARNFGIARARGEYLSILDGDDFYELDMLEKAYETAKKNNSDIVVFRSDNYYEDTGESAPMPWSIHENLLPEKRPFAGTDVSENIFAVFVGWAWDKLFKRSFVENLGIRFQEQRTSNDMFFVFCSIVKANRISVIDDVLAHHRRQSSASLSVTREKSWWCFHDALIAIRGQLREWGLFDRFERDYTNYCVHASLWNHDTLAEPTRSMLVEKLASEWADEFGISGKTESFFYAKGEYRKFRRIVAALYPKVSIIIPSLNSAEYYDECIASAVGQTMDEIEVLCIDAGSSDGTREIIASYQERDSRVKMIESDVRSYGHQLNMGFDAARGEYVFVLESDDYIDKETCDYYYKIARDCRLDFVKSDHGVFVGEGKNRKVTVRPLTKLRSYYGRILDPSHEEGCMYLTNLMQPGIYRLEFLRENDVRLNESPGASYQDNGFWWQVFTQAERAMFTERVCYYLRRDNPGSSVQSKGKVFAMCDEYDFIRKKLFDRGLERFLGICAYRRFGNYQFTAHRIGDWHRASFFERFAADFKELEAAGELDRRYYSPRDWSTLHEVMLHGADYYHLEWYYRERMETFRRERDNARKQKAAAEKRAASAEKALAKSGAAAKKAKQSLSRAVRSASSVPKRAVKRVAITSGLQLPAAKPSVKKPKKSRKVANPFDNGPSTFFSTLPASERRMWFSNMYAKRMGCRPQLENAQTYSEKAIARKIDDPMIGEKTLLTDKAFARKWAADMLGEDLVAPVFGCWDSFEEIDFDALPNSFVLQCTHGDRGKISVPDKRKLDTRWACDQFEVWLAGNFAFCGEFNPYCRGIQPMIMAEELPAEGDNLTRDAWVWCFGGKAHFVQMDGREDGKAKTTFFDRTWTILPFTFSDVPNHEYAVVRPGSLDQMFVIAEKLSSGYDHMRIHFNIVAEGKCKFKEIDFAVNGGFARWNPSQTDFDLGQLWDID